MRHQLLTSADGLIPFTRWITPTVVPKRFTTQMYLYFLPLRNNHSSTSSVLPSESEAVIPSPTSDGGKEHNNRTFPVDFWNGSPSVVLERSLSSHRNSFCCTFWIHFFAPENMPSVMGVEELAKQRERLVQFVKSGDPPWTEKCISPIVMLWKKSDRRAALRLDKPGLELDGSGRKGDDERVVLVNFGKQGPRELEVAWKKDVLEGERESQGSKEKL